MKKLIALLLALVMVFALAACGGTSGKKDEEEKDEDSGETTEATEDTGEATDDTTEGNVEDTTGDPTGDMVEDPTEEITEDSTLPMGDLNASAQVLANIWAKFPEAEMFPVAGGDFESSVMGNAGNVNVSTPDYLMYNLLIPEAQIANIVECGSLVHMMNGNNFTSGVVALAEGADVAAFASACRDAILGNQWMCGFPETLLIANIDGYILVAYGINDAMNPFITHMNEAYSNVEVLYNEAVVA